MCTAAGAVFLARHLGARDVTGRRVIEVGSRDARGAVRSIVTPLRPAEYVGVDMASGPGVDLLCPAEELIERFGESSFDVVISTEVLEHVQDWRAVVHNLKGVLRDRGLLIITTRSRGFEFHPYPLDFWRFEVADMAAIFGDLGIEVLRPDEEFPGVFLRARRHDPMVERDLSAHRAYSIVRRQPARGITAVDVAAARVLSGGKAAVGRMFPLVARTATRRVINRLATRGEAST
ncbi:methyltransferase type 11 [Streptacidiphilus pinicola]|uniref:Methyltransferase type 11 n=1 Tax=Streptacidiphilus pinicola TaxID=2219663 RepID=A0A2X0IMK2_9ACTN|nr:methyltransferase domain-containing protein [Streptacidiphilus pinicola]RAG85897.1 methyltransferase type 11 [Streptacidiphilus pinicola]